MTKQTTLWAALCVCLTLVLASCNIKEIKQENEDLRAQLAERDTELDEMMGIFNEVNEGFRKISETEGRVDLQRGSIAEGSKSARAQVVADMEFIQKQMEENKKQIENLQEMLRKSKNHSAQLQKAIDDLTTQLQEKTAQIEQLQAELAQKNIVIEELSQTVSNLQADNEQLTTTNQDQAQALAEQDKAINTAWYVFGTKSELKAENILTNGDVLTSADMNKDYFTEIDIRETTEIALYSKKVDILTSHPAGSYKLVQNSSTKQYTLKITNPTDFWSASRYLVIKVR